MASTTASTAWSDGIPRNGAAQGRRRWPVSPPSATTTNPTWWPVGFEYDGTHIKIGGYRPANTRRHRNVLAGHTNVAVVVDDLASIRL
ncbi:hypothetical protein ABQE69_03490 [Mycolicibacillus trivialis]